jgi:hypothetical protein
MRLLDPPHGQFDRRRLTVTTIHGGTASSVVPNHYQMDVDIRTVPVLVGESVMESRPAQHRRSRLPVKGAVVGVSSSSSRRTRGWCLLRTALMAAASRHQPAVRYRRIRVATRAERSRGHLRTGASRESRTNRTNGWQCPGNWRRSDSIAPADAHLA